jgi:hypothetical protein
MGIALGPKVEFICKQCESSWVYQADVHALSFNFEAHEIISNWERLTEFWGLECVQDNKGGEKNYCFVCNDCFLRNSNQKIIDLNDKAIEIKREYDKIYPIFFDALELIRDSSDEESLPIEVMRKINSNKKVSRGVETTPKKVEIPKLDLNKSNSIRIKNSTSVEDNHRFVIEFNELVSSTFENLWEKLELKPEFEILGKFDYTTLISSSTNFLKGKNPNLGSDNIILYAPAKISLSRIVSKLTITDGRLEEMAS